MQQTIIHLYIPDQKHKNFNKILYVGGRNRVKFNFKVWDELLRSI
jgi:hypothetical protein